MPDVQTKLRIEEDLVAWYHARAKEQDRTLSYVVAHALEQYRRRIEADKKRRRKRLPAGK